jgi:hypothetical protein
VNVNNLEVSRRSEGLRKGSVRWKGVAGMHICATVSVWGAKGAREV